MVSLSVLLTVEILRQMLVGGITFWGCDYIKQTQNTKLNCRFIKKDLIHKHDKHM